MSGYQEAVGDLVCVVSEKNTVEEVTNRSQTHFIIVDCVCVSVYKMYT